ncbi:MAG: GTPase ObgE [Patescibacteria group bacterium]|jgi:GTP-binding protein
MRNFADETKFEVKAGDGGNGAISLRHEKYVNKGGPDGGDGGDGGNVVLMADHNLNTLVDLTRRKVYQADSGKAGAKQKSAGKSGEDLILKVPIGTQVFEINETGDKVQEFLIADLTRDGEKFILAKGGEGGYGNAHFARASFQTPRFAELGTPGEEREVVLKLKIVADVGLIGLPNVGKSTLLSVISNARPKIADYEFTTLVPNLGIARYKDKSIVIADIPGLIEGASEGKGLGIKFLRHIERTKMLVHLLDATKPNPKQAFTAINKELKAYSPELAKRPQIVVFNKIDAIDATKLAQLKKLKFNVAATIFISAVAHTYVEDLLRAILKYLPKITRLDREAPLKIFTVNDLSRLRFEVVKHGNYYLVKGPAQEKLAIKTDFTNEQAAGRFWKVLKRMGVWGTLKKAGATRGDIIKLGSISTEFEDI